MSFAAIHRFTCWLLLASLTLFLAACGGGASSSTTSTPAGDTLTVSMALPDGTPANRFAAGTSANVAVVLLSGGDASKPIANARITFSTTATVATVALPSGQTLTDAKGKASTSLFGVAQGVDVLSVTAAYTDSKGTAQTVTGTLTYEVLQAVVAQPKITLSMDTGSNVTSGSQSILTAIVTNSAGQAVPNAMVTFTNDSSYAVFNPESGTALTDATGIARVGIVGTSKLGADKVTATAAVVSVSGVETTTSTTLNYQIIQAAAGSGPTLSLALSVDGIGTNVLTDKKDGVVTALFLDPKGAPISNALVTFEVDSSGAGAGVSLGSLGGTTDAQGRVTTSIFALCDITTAVCKRGPVTVKATATATKATSSASLVFNLIPVVPSIKSLTLSLPPGATTLPASSSAAVVASIVDAGTGAPLTDALSVTFTTACVQAGRASITSPVINIGGNATATYTDLGCGTTDTVTATVSSRSLSTTFSIAPATGASVTFVDASPAALGIKGSGTGEIGTVRFRLVDLSGNPVAGQTLTFGLSTTVGGLRLNTASAITDSSGYASASVQSGTVGTPLIVTATLASNSAIWAQSRQLYVTTKIPHQNGFSLSASTQNPEFYSYDGETVTLTVHASDRFGLPVPDGTQINFRTEGGIGIVRDTTSVSSPIGGCVTSASTCSVTLTSAGDRTRLKTVGGASAFDTGRQTITAFAFGEDSFDDNNGNGVFDNGDIFPPAANASTYRQGEPYIDGNENSQRDSTEEYVDYNNNGSYDGPDGKYRGIGCAHPTLCASANTRPVFDNLVIVWAGSTADFSNITLANDDVDGDTKPPISNATGHASASGLGSNQASVSFGASAASHGTCTDGQALLLKFPVTDGRFDPKGNPNPMPAGTTVTVTTTNGTLDASSTSYTVPNTTTAPVMSILLSSDATYDATAGCSNTLTKGVLTIQVTTPKNIVSSYSIGVQD
jgi:hypothetical protein